MTVGQSARLHSPGAGCEASVKPVLETQSLATRSCPSKEKDLAIFRRRLALLAERSQSCIKRTAKGLASQPAAQRAA